VRTPPTAAGGGRRPCSADPGGGAVLYGTARIDIAELNRQRYCASTGLLPCWPTKGAESIITPLSYPGRHICGK